MQVVGSIQDAEAGIPGRGSSGELGEVRWRLRCRAMNAKLEDLLFVQWERGRCWEHCSWESTCLFREAVMAAAASRVTGEPAKGRKTDEIRGIPRALGVRLDEKDIEKGDLDKEPVGTAETTWFGDWYGNRIN